MELVVIANCFALCDVSYGLVLQGISQWLNEATEDMETLSDGLLQKEVQRMQDKLMIESTYIDICAPSTNFMLHGDDSRFVGWHQRLRNYQHIFQFEMPDPA